MNCGNRIPVVVITPSMNHGGVQRVIYEVVTHLNHNIFKCYIICFFKKTENRLSFLKVLNFIIYSRMNKKVH